MDQLGLTREELLGAWVAAQALHFVPVEVERIVLIANELNCQLDSTITEKLHSAGRLTRQVIEDGASVILDDTGYEAARRALDAREAALGPITAVRDEQPPSDGPYPELHRLVDSVERTIDYAKILTNQSIQAAFGRDDLSESSC